jgi:calcineurin-like phosphoesterase family protein
MRFFIADNHLGNEKLIRGMLRRYPGGKKLFENTQAHDEHMLWSINDTVGVDDEIIILGDFSAQPGKYRAQIKCRHVSLVRGNHDPYQKCVNVFGDFPYIRHTKVRKGDAKLNVVLSHCPMAYWDGSHKGWGHLYGHTHGQREATLDGAFGTNRRAFDCGVDHLRNYFGSYRPISEECVYTMFMQGLGHDKVQFYHTLQAERDKRFFNDR